VRSEEKKNNENGPSLYCTLYNCLRISAKPYQMTKLLL